MQTDVAIFGGGPAGSTLGTLLRKYNPSLSVTIIERENFPRDHVGESQLPAISGVLAEMGVWDKVEAANFPIKVGSTYRWGNTDDLWNLNFLTEELESMPRPAQFAGQRTLTAFQIDRSIYDKILLDHAREAGCSVHEGVRAVRMHSSEDTVTGVDIEKSNASSSDQTEQVSAKYYVDATGGSGFLRRNLNIGTDSPTSLRNVALWDYWSNAEWAETVGNGGTRVQVMSLGLGWLWFIPVTPTRTSIGLVTPASHLKSLRETPEEIYLAAIRSEPRIKDLITKSTREGNLQTTKDWSYVSDRLSGDNWFLVGDSCGFADPILAAGMTLAHVGARKLAYTISEILRGELSADWLKSEFDRTHRASIRQHIRFADYWYSANGCFTDLKEYCTTIAADAGLDLNPNAAFQWLSTGGFTEGLAGGDSAASTVGFTTMKGLVQRFSSSSGTWQIGMKNDFRLNLAGAFKDSTSHYVDGRVLQIQCYRRGSKVLPLAGGNAIVYGILREERDAHSIAKALGNYFRSNPKQYPFPGVARVRALELIEAMIADGWVTATVNKKRPFIRVEDPG